MGVQGEENFHGIGGGVADQPQQKGGTFFNSRRAGSSWNRGVNSAWNLRGRREAEKVKGGDPVRRCGTDSEAPTFDSHEELFAAERAASPSEDDIKSSSTTGNPQVHLQVKKEREYFNVDGSVETVVDPDTLYGIITDFDSNARVFRNVDRVQVEGKGNEKVVTQFLHWNFLMWSGNYDIKMKIKNDPQTRSISYELAQPGFLKIFNGSWTCEPLVSEDASSSSSSKLILKQRALPSYFPPGPLAVGAGSYASKIMSSQVSNLLADLATEACEVKKRTAENV